MMDSSERLSDAVGACNRNDRYPNGPPSRFPCLLLADKKEDDVRKKYFPSKKEIGKLLHQFPSLIRTEEKEDDIRELFCLSNKSIRKIRLPEATGKLCMSSGGWLLTVGNDFDPKLIHPFSRRIINLPKMYTFPEFGSTSHWYRGFRKLVLVESSSLVVVLWGCSGKLGFCRSEDQEWTAVLNGQDGMFFDITYLRGRVYSFACNHRIQYCDVSKENPTIVTVSTLPKDLYGEWWEGNFVHKWLEGAYIVGLEDNELLVIVREGMYDATQDALFCEVYKTTSFRVFKYDLDSQEWSEIMDLGTKALFVGYSQSFWMDADSGGVIKGNCIYFTDDVFDLYAGSVKGGGRDMGVYHMSSGTVEPHFDGDSRSHLTPPIWLQPI